MIVQSNKQNIRFQLSRTYMYMLAAVSALLVCTAVSCSADSENADFSGYYFPDENWERIENLEEAGWSQERLQTAKQMTDSLDTAALMIIHKGKIVDFWGDMEHKYRCHSIRKSFLSALYGFPISDGTIDRNSTMEDLGIDDNEGLTDVEKQATVQMLLQARSGIYHPALYETAAMTAAKPERHSHTPGTNYHYNNWDFNALGTIYEQETGENIHQSFEDRIARPIAMQDYSAEDGRYFTGDASRHAAYPFVMSTRDMARFGLLFLNNGVWDGERVLPEGWVEESTRVHSVIRGDRSDRGGYGYMWWVEVDGRHFAEEDRVPKGTYTGRGAGGHVLAVIPEYDLVVVHRVDTGGTGNRVPYNDFGRVLMAILDAYQEV